MKFNPRHCYINSETLQDAKEALEKYHALTDSQERREWLAQWDTLGKGGNQLKIASSFTKSLTHDEATSIGSVEDLLNRNIFFYIHDSLP